MSFAIAGWQILIFSTIVISGRAAGLTTGFWVIWTFVQIYTLPLSIIQFATILIAYLVAKAINREESEKENTVINRALKRYQEWQDEPSMPLWPMYVLAGGIFLLTQILPSSDSEQHQPTPESLEPQNQAYSTSAKSESIGENIGPQPFTIRVTPSNARVRIMNIKPKYRDSIILDDGSYDVLVDAPGYISWRQNIQHSGKPTYRNIKLNEKTASNSHINERKNVSLIIDGRYRDNGDGTILDTTTKLQWMRCSIGQSWNGSNCSGSAYRIKWDDIMKKTPSFAGYSDWRIPKIEELKSLIYCSNAVPKLYPSSTTEGRICEGGNQKPTINLKAFPNTPIVYYWSITKTDRGSARIVGFKYGAFSTTYTFSGYKQKNEYRVRLVRNLR